MYAARSRKDSDLGEIMKRRYKILIGAAGVIAVAVVTLGAVLAHESPCPAIPESTSGDSNVKAWMYRCYGGPEVLQLESMPKPVPADDEVLVKVHAASLNPLDWHYLRGEPRLMRMEAGIGAPKEPSLGVDYAGVVESVGKDVTKFKAGDEVYGARGGAFGEYVRVRESRNIVLKPASLSFQQAAAVPIAAVTALQAVRDQGKVKRGQKVLINGASGGVGTFAVQLAKNLGAEVTAVCSGRNVEMVGALGADHVVDYTKEDVTAGTTKFDVIIDTVGTHSLSDYRRVMTDHAEFVIVGAPNEGKWLGAMSFVMKAKVYGMFVSQQFHFFLAEVNPGDLNLLSALMQEGKVKPVIDKTYPMSELPEAMRYLEAGHARGKIVINIE